MKRLIFAYWLVFITIQASNAFASVQDCKNATDQYNMTVNDLSDRLKRYTKCLSVADGHDDCSIEFKHLRSSQDDFELSVSNYEMECQ